MMSIFNNSITKYLVAVGFTIAIVLLYQLVEVPFFSLDLQRTVRERLFNRLRVDPQPDHSIMLFNAGTRAAQDWGKSVSLEWDTC